MKKTISANWTTCLLFFYLMLPLCCRAEQFLEINAELEVDDWDYHFFDDAIHARNPNGHKSSSIFFKPGKIHCIVGTNAWMIERGETNQTEARSETYWFTGSNVVYYLKQGQTSSAWVTRSLDGNPGRPVRHADLMFGAWGKACWLALCSGPFLKQPGRQIPLPSDLWKETERISNFPDKTTVFNDALGLPQSICQYAGTNQVILQYQVHQSSNVLGWNIPLEFYLIQYRSSSSNGMVAEICAKARVTNIQPSQKPEVPEKVLKNARQLSD